MSKLELPSIKSQYSFHRTSLKNKAGEYVNLLEELSSEQKFEVTYVENEERGDDGEVQSLVQLSTMPVAVCYGTGSDKNKANQDAARNALNYLKMMTKNPNGGGNSTTPAANGSSSSSGGGGGGGGK